LCEHAPLEAGKARRTRNGGANHDLCLWKCEDRQTANLIRNSGFKRQ
jgi:hypothetical protein